ADDGADPVRPEETWSLLELLLELLLLLLLLPAPATAAPFTTSFCSRLLAETSLSLPESALSSLGEFGRSSSFSITLSEMGFAMSTAQDLFLRSKLRRKNETGQNELKRENHLL